LATAAGLERRERAVVTDAAVIPNIDGLVVAPELLTRHSQHPLLWFSEYHHILHTLLFAIVVS
jgi:inner membrane protein